MDTTRDTNNTTKGDTMPKLSDTMQNYLAAACAGFRPYGRTVAALAARGLVNVPRDEDGEPLGDQVEYDAVTDAGRAVAAELGLDWDAGDPPPPSEYDTAEIEKMEASAAAHRQARLDSQERSDTDGFLSQWASGLSSGLDTAKADIHRNGGRALLAILVDRETGRRVEAWEGRGEWGSYWKIKNDADVARYGHRFFPRNSTGRKLWSAGLRMVNAWLPAEAFMDGEGHGLSGNAWVATRELGTS